MARRLLHYALLAAVERAGQYAQVAGNEDERIMRNTMGLKHRVGQLTESGAEQPAKPAQAAQHMLVVRAGDCPFHQAHGAVPRIDADPGPFVSGGARVPLLFVSHDPPAPHAIHV